MGIKLKELIKLEYIEIAEIKGKKIAIDGMNMLFQLLKNPYSEHQQKEYYDSTQRPISHLYGWLQKVKAFQKYQFDVVVVFDGKPEDLKRIITKDIARDFLAVEQKYKAALAAGRKDEARYWANSPSYRWQNTLNESRLILEASGIPVIMAPSEAEAQCAVMQRDGIVDFMVSWDYDAMLFGATKILRSLTFAGRRQVNGQWQNFVPKISLIDCDKELTRLQLNRYQLIDLGILVGNDYFPGIDGLGITRSYEAIQVYQNIEKMIQTHPNLFHSLPLSKLQELRTLFFNPVVRHVTEFPKKPIPNPDAINHLLLSEHTLSKEKVDRYVKRNTSRHALKYLKKDESINTSFVPANFKFR